MTRKSKWVKTNTKNQRDSNFYVLHGFVTLVDENGVIRVFDGYFTNELLESNGYTNSVGYAKSKFYQHATLVESVHKKARMGWQEAHPKDNSHWATPFLTS